MTHGLTGAVDVSNEHSFSSRMRARRFARFLALVDRLVAAQGHVDIVDLGGTNAFWESAGFAGRRDVRIVAINYSSQHEQRHENIVALHADVTAVPADDRVFDVVFSNSTIEHLYTFSAQQAMAREVLRLAPRHFVQTPNFWFPVEPHFLAPGWQYLPERLRAEIVMRRKVGHRGPRPVLGDALRAVEEVRMLTARELRHLFPGSELVAERMGPLVKSWTAVRDCDCGQND